MLSPAHVSRAVRGGARVAERLDRLRADRSTARRRRRRNKGEKNDKNGSADHRKRRSRLSLLLPRARVCYMTLSDVTEASRKPSKRRRYNSIYLKRKREKGERKERECERERGLCDVICAMVMRSDPGDAAEVEWIEIF